MRRLLLLLFVICTALALAYSLWPAQVGGYLDLFGQRAVVNRGVAVTVLAVLVAALVVLRVRLWRSERALERIRRGQPPAYPPAPWDPSAYPPPPPWDARAVR